MTKRKSQSTIIDNWQQLFWSGHQLSTITNNFFSFWVNHTAKQIVPFRAKNYQQLPTICKRLFKGSTIINNYQQLFGGGQQLPTIGNNLQETIEGVNHTAKQIVPFRAKNYQQLPTIFFRSCSRDYCGSHCEHREQPN